VETQSSIAGTVRRLSGVANRAHVGAGSGGGTGGGSFRAGVSVANL